jgi:ABC-type oligopeptide transport system ATPase subunit
VSGPLLQVEALSVHFPVRGGGGAPATLRAVDAVGFEIAAGETLGVVGESGCGKSTLARALLRLVPIHSGRVHFDGTDYTHADERGLRPLRRAMRMVFQDPMASLNPRFTVRQACASRSTSSSQGGRPASATGWPTRCWTASGSVPRSRSAIRTNSPAARTSA